jgi:L-ascorbate metabolism protein UlaG (beta-lactamase superfamily)
MASQGALGRRGASASLAVTWAGHATALIELDGTRLLTDPLLRDRVGPLVRIGSPVAADLRSAIDAVLISHLHADHAHVRSLRRLPRWTPILAPPGARRWLARHGLPHVEELRVGAHADVGGVRIWAAPAVHDGRRWPLGPSAEAVGFVARGSQSCYFAGDTALHPDMGAFATGIDLALLPVWGWGPSLGPGHLDPVTAAEAARLISPRVVVPIHWGTFALAWHAPRLADPQAPARRFAQLVQERAPAVEVRLLAPGGRTEIAPPAPPIGEPAPERRPSPERDDD